MHLIVRRDFDWYNFHCRSIENHGKFTQMIEWGGELFTLDLFMAYTWGIFVEKIFSPRVVKELVTENNYSYDARDIFTILDSSISMVLLGSYQRCVTCYGASLLPIRRNLRQPWGISEIYLPAS